MCSFNLFNYLTPPNAFYETENIYSAEQWQGKERWISDQLTRLQADIVGFQEVFSPKELAQLVSENGLVHFATVSKPSIKEQYVYEKPVVALASKFPIESLNRVEVDSLALKNLNIQPDFSFSRPPLKAEVNVEGLGTVLVYVVHLKSQRSQFEMSFDKDEAKFPDIAQSMLAQVHGRWASSVQRGTESALIYQDILKEMLNKERPVILMGDLNDISSSPAISPLFGGAHMDKLNNKLISGLNLTQQRAVRRSSLYDAYFMQEHVNQSERKPTHYFANRGNVLDYILLSKDFDGEYDHSIASVSNYTVSDKHLVNPKYSEDAECSDHAVIMAEIELRF